MVGFRCRGDGLAQFSTGLVRVEGYPSKQHRGSVGAVIVRETYWGALRRGFHCACFEDSGRSRCRGGCGFGDERASERCRESHHRLRDVQ